MTKNCSLEEIRLPEFIIGGVAKSATTSIAKMISQHEQVSVSNQKEPYFFSFDSIDSSMDESFARNIIFNIEDYSKLFGNNNKLSFEASTSYLYTADFSIEKIKRIYSKHSIKLPKMVFILRDPVERAFSHYMFLKRSGEESRELQESMSLNVDKDLLKRRYWDFDYLNYGFYSDNLKKYIAAGFECKVYLFEDLMNPHTLCSDLCQFLGLKQMPVVQEIHANKSGQSRFKAITRFFGRSNWLKRTVKPYLSNSIVNSYYSLQDKLLNLNVSSLKQPAWLREKYIKVFIKDINEIERLIDRDLTKWKRP